MSAIALGGKKMTVKQFKNYKSLSENNIEFLNYVSKNEKYFDLNFFENLTYTDKLSFLSPWPTFLSNKMQKEFSEISLTLGSIIKKIPYQFLEGDIHKIATVFELSPEEAESCLANTDQHFLDDLLFRGDYVLTENGLKCIEMNGGAGLGGWQLPFFENIIFKNPLIEDYFKKMNIIPQNKNLFYILFEHILRCVSKNNALSTTNRNIAITTTINRDLIGNELNDFNKWYGEIQTKMGFDQNHGKIFFIHWSDLTVLNNQVFLEEKEINIVIDWTNDVQPEIQKIYNDKKVIIYNGDISRIVGNKLSIAYLSEAADNGLFSIDTNLFIKKHIPWTRKVKNGKIRFMAVEGEFRQVATKFKNKLVLKSALECGGKQVHLGKYTSPEAWQVLLTQSLIEKDWVVQEHLDSISLWNISKYNNFSLFGSVWGLLTFGNNYAGAFLRVLPYNSPKYNGLINSRQGASISVVCNTTL